MAQTQSSQNGSRYSTISRLQAKNVYVCSAVAVNINWCESYTHGRIWLDGLLADTRTITVYMQPFRRFCDFVGKDPDQLFTYHLDGQALFRQDPIINFNEANRINDLLTNVVPQMKMQKTGESITPSMSLRVIVAVRSFFTWNHQTLAKIRFPLVQPNPANAIPVTIPEVESMLQSASVRDKAMIAYFASTGFRPETVTLQKWKDFMPTGNTQVPMKIIAVATIMKGKGASKAYFYCNQFACLNARVWKYMDDYRKAINAKPDDAVFQSELPETGKWKTKDFKTKTAQNGNSISYFGIWKAIHVLGQKTLNKNVNTTDFRHFVADACASANLSDMDTGAFLGHAIRSTNRSYIPLTPQRQAHLLQKYIEMLPYLVT